MASPQLENGYCRIAHGILEALARHPLSGRHRRILDVIFRESFGHNRKEALLSLRDISNRTGIAKRHCSTLLRELGFLKLVTVSRVAENGNHAKSAWSFQKDFDQWGAPNMGTVPKNRNGSVPKDRNAARTRAVVKREKNTPAVPCQEFLDVYNTHHGRLPAARGLSSVRREHIAVRLSEHPDLSYWAEVVKRLAASDFACGGNWATIDFLIGNDNNHIKVMEGKYDNRPVAVGSNGHSMEDEGWNPEHLQ